MSNWDTYQSREGDNCAERKGANTTILRHRDFKAPDTLRTWIRTKGLLTWTVTRAVYQFELGKCIIFKQMGIFGPVDMLT